tara:strand:+ start:2375 stop:3463 length:1089 start_codon:yes stop_codon:yes gene_type:complete
MEQVITLLFAFLSGLLFGGLIFFIFNKTFIRKTFEDQFNETSAKVIEEIQNKESREDRSISQTINVIKQDLQKEVKDLTNEISNAKTAWNTNTTELRDGLNSLSSSHSKWVAALSNSSVRGSFAEQSLKKMLNDLSFVENVSYFEQESMEGDESGLRPDIIIKTAEGGSIIIDSKAPLKAYIEAIEEQDLQKKRASLKKHAKDLFEHVKDLAAKDYSAYEMDSPDFVIMWLDNVSAFTAAVEEMPDIVEKSAELKVMLCPPSLVFACLKTIELSFTQQKMAGNANKIIELGSELHRRASKFTDEFKKINSGLESAKKALGKSMSSWNARLMPTLRKFEELSDSSNKIEDLEVDFIEDHREDT